MFYCFIDRPIQFNKDLKNWNDLSRNARRRLQRHQRPKKQHLTFKIAQIEAKRLAQKTKSRVFVLQIVDTIEPE